MKTTDVKDITIRADDTAKAGIDGPSGVDVAAPETVGNPSGAPTGGTPVTIPSVAGLPIGPGGSDSGLMQPSCSHPADTSSVGSVAPGSSVGFPAASDKVSAGGIKTTSTLVEKTGSVVKFPPAADTSMQPKVVDSFGK